MKVHRLFRQLMVILIFLVGALPGSAQKARQGRQINPQSITAPAALQISQNSNSWQKVDSLVNLGQPRSALEIVEQIYARATQAKDDPQLIKTVIYRIRLGSDYQERFMENTIASLKKEVAASAAPARQVLQSILAEVYWKYYQNNQYRFRNRTQVNTVLPDSIDTWDLVTLYNTITRTYLLSLSDPDSLKRIAIGRFNDILEQELFNEPVKDTLLKNASSWYPTLYDFLANRALDFFSSGESVKALPARHFEVDQPWYFAPSFNFSMNRMMIPADTAAPASFALRIYRDLAAFHLKDSDRRALIETELKRLAFVHDNYVNAGGDSLYHDALVTFEKNHLDTPWGTSVSYVLAGYLNSRGQLYQPLISDLHKWDCKTAAAVCAEATLRYPDSPGGKNCKILAHAISEPFLQLSTASAVPNDKPSLALAGVKNLKQLFFRLVLTDPDTYSEKAGKVRHDELFNYLVSLPAARSWSQEFPDDGDLQKHQAEIMIPGVPPGFWLLVCSASKNFSQSDLAYAYTPFWSTHISYISKRNDNGTYGYFLFDRETGAPLKKLNAECWEKNYDYRAREYNATKRFTLVSDEQGYLELPTRENERQNSNLYLKIFDKEDFVITDNFYQYPPRREVEQTVIQTMLYTDRAIYRPGQTIFFKGIIIEKTGDRSVIKTGYPTKVVLTDANGQRVAEQKFRTNDFGSFNGSFVAPIGVLPGLMAISNETASAGFSVEEYRRPTFDVTFDPLQGNYRLGETLNVPGKAVAYAGNGVDGAKVSYRVVRAARFPYRDWGWYWPMPVSQEAEIASGSLTTDAQGTFTVSFTAYPDPAIDKKSNPVFDYMIYTDVTDMNGETQLASQSVSVSFRSLMLGAGVPGDLNLEDDTIFRISATNLNGQPLKTAVSVTLQRLRPPTGAFVARLWDRPDRHILSRGEFSRLFPGQVYDNENTPETWEKEPPLYNKVLTTRSDSGFTRLDKSFRFPGPGSYLLILKATDPFGDTVETRSWITAYNTASKEVPVNESLWVKGLKTTCLPGENARFLVGTRDNNVNLVCEVRLHDSLLTREIIRLSNRVMVYEIPVKEQYRGNFSVNFMFVKNNRAYQSTSEVNVPYPDKKLDITVESFRNKLDPGSKETWKIKIARPGGKPASAEFMAGMYDASLDVFRANNWDFNLYERFWGVLPWDIDNSFRSGSGQWPARNPGEGSYTSPPSFRLNWFGTGFFQGSTRYSRRGGLMQKGTALEMMDAPVAGMNATEQPEVSRGNTGDVAGVVTATTETRFTEPPKQAPAVQVRRDFRETAFFYPVMETDSTGSLLLSFTVPESLTKWNFMGLAHTKALDHGTIRKETITRKEVMVFPNVPRFVRQGDTVIFSTKVVNMSEGDLSGEVSLSLADGINLKTLNNLIDTLSGTGLRVQSFRASKGQSAMVSWRLFIPVSTDLSLLQFRVTAVAGKYTDGEEKSVPVLVNRMMVTESLPLPVRGKGTFNFRFDKLLGSAQAGSESTLKNYRLTLEFATNPAWYAIQALPALNDRKYDNVDAIFAAYWSNSMASFIASSNPKIRAVFESWKNLTPDALLSNLSKNQQLKSALLQETPWVLESINETGRKQKLGLFFDPANIAANLEENLARLRKLQTPDGGWTWFAGMPGNRYITQDILTGMAKLYHMGIKTIMTDPATHTMIVKAIGYMDREMQRDYDFIRKNHPKFAGENMGHGEVQYLYARSFFMADPATGIGDLAPEHREAFAFFKKQAETYWNPGDRCLQGMIALALNRLGSKAVPALIVKSLSEKALHSDEMGMYWAGERGYLWYQAPIETQALMIELFDEVARDHKSVEEMKVWLLKQKQTQDWRSSHATLEACYALLLRGTDLLAEDPGVRISVGTKTIDSQKPGDITHEAGTGYFQYSWSGSEITPDMGKISVTRNGEGVAWGALYWQYFEDLDKITPAATPLHLEKRVFEEVNTPAGPVLEPISNEKGSSGSTLARSLTTGAKLKVRIILTADRNLEYVHMKDLRASAFEPSLSDGAGTVPYGWGAGDGLSGYRYQDGLGYYQSTTDQATNFFFDYLPKGTYVFEYPLKVNAAGFYSNGITTIQCMYAPEFTAHSEGIRITVR